MIENGICSITYPNGKMSLVMDQFFPTNAHNIRLLLKTIALNWSEREQTANDILHWLKGAHKELDAENKMRTAANTCVDFRTKAVEMQPDIDRQAAIVEKGKRLIPQMIPASRKYARERLKEEKEKLKAMKESQRSALAASRYYNGQFIKVQVLDRKFKANIELIEQLTAGWG